MSPPHPAAAAALTYAAGGDVVLVLHALVAVPALDVGLAGAVAGVEVALKRCRAVGVTLARATTLVAERVEVRL